MSSVTRKAESESHRWVRYHVIAFFAIIGVSAGLIIVDAKVAEIIGQKQMSGFRTILLLSILLAGLGARALLAWRSATVDLQGRIFLAVMGLVLLTGAAYGLADCRQEIYEHLKASQDGDMIVQQPAPPPRPSRNKKPKPGAAKNAGPTATKSR